MEHSHILLSFFIVITMVFIATANDGDYKMLSYGEDFPAYPWQRVNHRELVQPIQRRGYDNVREEPFDLEPFPYNNEPAKYPNGTYYNPKRTWNFEEKMAELNNFGRGFGVKAIYGRVPVPVMLVPSYERPEH